MREWIECAVRMQVPFFGHDDCYCLGTGAAAASGTPGGVWNFAVGPDLTCPNHLESEILTIDGSGALPFRMHRLRGCGAFFGIAVLDGLRATLTEAGVPDGAKLLRLLTLENETTQARAWTLDVQVAPGAEAIPGADGVELVSPAGAWCFGNHETKNWAERRLRIRIPGARLFREGGIFHLRLTVRLAPAEMAVLPIWHDFAYGGDYEPDADPAQFLNLSMERWSQWLSMGRYPGAIRNRRLRDAVESLLLSVRMQQNRDGGMIAGIRKYANSYIRDTHGGMRLLNICGHTQDTARLLKNIHSRWALAGFIPNWWSMGSDTFIGNSFHNDASEITAYYLFMLRDYLEAGGDRAILGEILPSIRWAAEAQADFLRSHGLLLDFNGDETEKYCVNRDGEEYGLFGTCHSEDRIGFDNSAFSFASTAAAAGSLEWFGRLVGEEDYVVLARQVRDRLDEAFWDGSKGRHGWILDGNGLRNTLLTNAALLPMWLKIGLNHRRERDDALAAIANLRPDTGYLPNCPGVTEGFCGHTPGLALYCTTLLDRPEADALADTILNSNLLSRYGTVSEFYGPGGTPNGHSCRPFEGGIVGEALVVYAQRKENHPC